MKKQISTRVRFDTAQLRLLLPVIIPVVLLSLVPLLQGIYFGFTDYQLGSAPAFNGLDNYRYMLQDHYFWRSFQVGFIWTVTVTGAQLVLGLLLAVLLNTRVRFSGLYSLLILVPWAMPPVIRGVVWRQMFDPDTGAVNFALGALGIIQVPVNWLTSYQFAIPAVIVAGIWGELPKTAVFLYAGLQTIPKDFYESAQLDGAGAWTRFRHITLPLLKPVLAVVLSLNFIWNFNSFGLVWVLTQGGPGGLTRLPMLAAYEEAFRYGFVGYAAAIGNVMVVFVIAALYFYLRIQFREQVDAGGAG